jgi:hypothetical protein
MRKTFENYTWLTGNHGRRGSLWKGEDHLLAVEGTGILYPYSEQYRRVDYKNIQAITSVLTKRYWLILFALLVPILGLAAAASLSFVSDRIPLAITFGLILLPFLCILVLHLVMGRTCVCTIQTAVQNMRLKPLTRVNKAKQVMREIESLCLLHQGPMPADAAAVVSALPRDFTVPGTKPLWQGSIWVMAAGIGLTLFAGALVVFGTTLLAGLASAQYSTTILYTEALLGIAALICSIVGLTRAVKAQTPDGLMATLWTSLVLELIGGGIIYLLVIFHRMAQTESSGGSRNAFSRLISLEDLTLEQLQVAGWIVLGLGCVFAVPGLILMFYGMRKGVPQSKPPVSPATPPVP